MLKIKFIIIMLLLTLLYLLSLLKFIDDIDNSYTISDNIEGIVILTGSKGRLGLGIEYMYKNSNIKMLISGVGHGVRYSDLILDDNLNSENITLGFEAKNTMQNAIETLHWVKNNNINSFILVTDNWHMKRSLLYFKSIIPNRKIFSKTLKSIEINNMFHEPRTIIIVVTEHVKYLISYFQILYYWTMY